MCVYLKAPQYWSLWEKYGFDESDLVPGGSDRLIDMLVAWGDAAEIQRQITAYFEAGATDVILRVPTDSSQAVNWSIVDDLAPAHQRLPSAIDSARLGQAASGLAWNDAHQFGALHRAETRGSKFAAVSGFENQGAAGHTTGINIGETHLSRLRPHHRHRNPVRGS